MDLIENEVIELEGFITFYKYENEASGYRIASFKIDDNKQERTVTIVGNFPKFAKTDALKVKGNLIRHKKFGIQIQVVEIYKKMPTSKENIIRFLSSSQFKKVGKKAATNLFEYLKEDCISILINNPKIYEELIENKIISEAQATSLQEGLRNFDFTSNAYQTLLRYGFSLKNIMKAEAVYGDELEKVINENPYQMILDIDGIGFKSVDKIALNSGIKEDDKRRVKAAILYSVISFCHMSGDTFLTIDKIYSSLTKLIKVEENTFSLYVKELIIEGLIINEDEKYYHYTLYKAENNIAKALLPFIHRKINQSMLNMHFETLINTIQEDEGIIYSKEQIEAIYGALSSGLYIITGGPGTGKTTILNAILKLFKIIYGEDVIISLCAPTGRASKRMSMLSNHYACTIHRLLKWDLHSNTFAYNKDNRLKCDIIIIDEFSMVDTLLFEALLNGTISVSQIILIGDDGQIPSVGAGNLLHDLLKIEEIKHISLSHIYRQSNGSSIVDLSYNIRFNKLDESFKFNGDVSFVKIKNTQVADFIVHVLEKLFDQGFTFDDIQIIIPMYGNVAGIDNINAAIQQWYNPKSDDLEIRVNHQVFRIGDRVLQLKNQPEDDIYNGDIGVITDIDLIEEEITVEFDVGEVIYTKPYFSNLTLAYAISIHKSQGSEFDFVIMCVFNDYGFMLNKQLLYTGITRAKKKLLILGDYFTFIKKSMMENTNIRNTGLVEMINKVIE